MSISRHHAEWRDLVEVSGPFVSMAVLEQVFPQGIETVESELRDRLRVAHEEWLDATSGPAPDVAIHNAFIRYVFREGLGYDEGDILQDHPSLRVEAPEHHDTLTATFAIKNPAGRADAGKPRLFVSVLGAGDDVDRPQEGVAWKIPPVDRMLYLLRGAQAGGASTRLGLVTNGEDWVLVFVTPGETSTYVRWSTELWFDEPLTLRAMITFVSARRLFGVPDEETFEALISRSAKDAHEVTDRLGFQVRRATEVLVETIDRVDRGRRGKLLGKLAPVTVYEGAVTVMMRLIFVLAAEERKLLLLGTPMYDQHYAVSTLHDQLQAMADRHGEEILEKRFDAWVRLLSTFRAIYAGIEHDILRIPAHGGSLFDPDRFPFLEGRAQGTSFLDPGQKGAAPLAVDNRTVLHLLRAITRLEVKAGGGRVESRRLSFRELDVEQIGHVYEGLLDHTAKRAEDVTVSLAGKKEPEIPVGTLEGYKKKSPELVTFLAEETGRSESAIAGAFEYKLPKDEDRQLLAVCENVADTYERVKPWAGLIRKNTHGLPAVFPKGALYVTEGADRRSTGTHYTPRSLTEPIVQHTLDPLVYVGPAEGKPREAWVLKSAKEILALRVCDLAMGSGAFLVAACRYLAARLIEAWDEEEKRQGGKLVLAPDGALSAGAASEQAIPLDPLERLALAKRYVADRCLYGVDVNPWAVEMGKLSLWLATMQKGRPFSFLDHALRCGDSLLGVTNETQLHYFHLDPARGKKLHANLLGLREHMKIALGRSRELREKIKNFATNDINDARQKAWLLAQANQATEDIRVVGDLLMGAALATVKGAGGDEMLVALSIPIVSLLDARSDETRTRRRDELRSRANELLDTGRMEAHPLRNPFHWPIAFPEVTAGGGFDACIGNPPFKYGTLAAQTLSETYMRCLQNWDAPWHGKADLVVGFLKRATKAIRSGGHLGILATAGIVRGESLESSLRPLLRDGWELRGATTPRQWPGGANVDYVTLVIAMPGQWDGPRQLDGRNVPRIGESLDVEELEDSSAEPFEIESCFAGHMGVKLSPSNNRLRDALLGEGVVSRSGTLVALGGDELYSLTDFALGPRVVDPAADSLRPDLIGLLRRLGIQRASLEHSRPAQALHDAARGAALLFACGETSVHLAFRAVPKRGVLLTHKAIGFPASSWAVFGILQSTFHVIWAWRWGLRRQARLTYSPKRCAATFPRPLGADLNDLDRLAQALHSHRDDVMSQQGEGLTETYNRFHRSDEQGVAIRKLRDMHVTIDVAVGRAFGWSDVRLEHDFRQTPRGVRFTVTDAVRSEILRRLLALNHVRHGGPVESSAYGAVVSAPSRASTERGKRIATRVKAGGGGQTELLQRKD